MKASAIRPCDLSGQPLCSQGIPLFYRIVLQTYGIDKAALHEWTGLHHLFEGKASPALLEVFSTKPDIATLIHEPADLLVCQDSILDHDRAPRPLLLLYEMAHKKQAERKQTAGHDDGNQQQETTGA